MLSKTNLENLYLILAAIGAVGFFATTDYLVRMASVIIFLIGIIFLLRR